jgi:hypothetical protein
MSKNFATSTVATAPTPAASGTSLVVAAGTGSRFFAGPASVYPAGSTPTPANAEVVNITAVSTDTLTITRQAESSSARTIVAGDVIQQGVTAGMWDGLSAVSSVVGQTGAVTGAQILADTTVAAALAAKADAITFTDKGAWAATTVYVIGDVVTSGGLRYLCRTAHTSGGSFAVGTNWVAVDLDLSATYAPIASPTFTGTPAGPTAAPGTSTTQLATTAFVQAASSSWVFQAKTANYTAASGEFVLANAAAGGFTVTLPASPATGRSVRVKKTDGTTNVVTVVGQGGTTIDGDANATLIAKGYGGEFVFDGTNWQIGGVTQ